MTFIAEKCRFCGVVPCECFKDTGVSKTTQPAEISHAQVFKENGGSLSIEYFDSKDRWARISGGFDKVERLVVEEHESQEEFLTRLKEYVWDTYLRPTSERFGKLAD